MDKTDIELTLRHFLKGYLRTRLANRLITYALLNLAVYMLLLTVIILADSSLFVFHLLFFCSLSLLPLFLFLGMERTTLRRIVRTIDERCLVESYLQTSSAEHRSFMQERVESHLARKKSDRTFPFRLFTANFYLIGLCLSAFVFLQAVSLITLRDFTTPFSAQNLKTKLLERGALQKAIAELPVEVISGVDSSATEEQRATAGGENVEQRAGKDLNDKALEELLGDDTMVAKDRIDRLSPDDLRQEPDQGQKQRDTGWNYQALGTESDTDPEKTQGFPGDEGQEIAREGRGAEAGSSDVGRTYEESPLRKYAAIPEQVAAKGSEVLSPTGNLEEGQKRIFLNALFADFAIQTNLRISFNPLFDSIRERYLELLDELF